jgi:TetR/AcrR family transcriptional regulator, transcriptional repressor for nem operon
MDTREHLIKESLKLFLCKSFKDVTVDEILQKSGLSKGAFYYYFKSKEQLFLEIAEVFFSYMIIFNFESYSRSSLKAFYSDHVRDLGRALRRFSSEKEYLGNPEANVNYFYPIFDALRILPEFGKKFRTARQNELECWKSAISKARETGEIKSVMTDEQIALIFIYTGNSIGLQLIMENQPIQSLPEQYLKFWDSFYCSLIV